MLRYTTEQRSTKVVSDEPYLSISKEIGIDIGFAICDENGLPRTYRRYGEALVLSITLVSGKAYTAAVTQCKTKDVAAWAVEGGSLMAIQDE